MTKKSDQRRTKVTRRKRAQRTKMAVGLVILVGAASVYLFAKQRTAQHVAVALASIEFSGGEAETRGFMADNRSIRLTADQEAIRTEALEALPAACCNNFSAATCCCECNLSRATWGLSKRLISEQGLDAVSVRAAVSKWHETVNPNGFSGDTCPTGGCGRAFANNGCGGMLEDHLVF